MAQASDASDIYRRQGVGFNDPLAPPRDRVAGTR
jgi:hypothetical protein